MADGDLPAVAGQQVHAQHDEQPDGELAHVERPELADEAAEEGPSVEKREQREHDAQQQECDAARRSDPLRHRHTLLDGGLPSSPAGRIMRTTTITTNAAVISTLPTSAGT